METRANHIWVGAVTLALLGLAMGLALWLAHLSRNERHEYDIYFRQSVDGLANGAPVSYSGVPAGQIVGIELKKDDPGLVRVRVAINPDVPILEGTKASIQGSFTGVSAIQLSGGLPGAPPLTRLGPDGVPQIPTKQSGLGALLSNAPLLLERLSGLTERLGDMLSDKNQQELSGILANTNRLTRHLADASPQVGKTLADLDTTLVQAQSTLAAFQQVAGRVDAQLDPNGASLARQLADTLRAARDAAQGLQATMAETAPTMRRVNNQTLPEAENAIRELRATSKALRELTEKIDNQGATALISPPKLPEYHP
jgi:phospholipid/cholesterol/gamma-HCH transport system substrate-binding protein